MKKLVSLLLVVMMVFAVVGSFADPMEPIEIRNKLDKFLDETDLKTKDLSLRLEEGDASSDLIIRLDGDNLHLVTRSDDKEVGHVQLNPTGMYVASGEAVTLLRHATMTNYLQEIVNEVKSAVEEAAKAAPAEKAASAAEMQKAVEALSILAAKKAAQEEADAVTLGSAAMSFADKFKPENILDVKQEEGSVEISLRSDAFATAVADATDELLSNPALAELVDRRAALTGGETFAEAQTEWLKNREATLAAMRSVESTEKLEDNGHYVSHFQIGEEGSATKILVCDTDSWIDTEYNEVEFTFNMGFKDEDPLMTYTFTADEDSYRETMNTKDAKSEVRMDFDEDKISRGVITSEVDGKETMKVDFSTDYLYVKGPKGALSTSVRETITGKTRYEIVGETIEGEETTIIFDFYDEDDALVAEMKLPDSDESMLFRISRIDKEDIADLSAAEKIIEITGEDINTALETLVKLALPLKTTDAGTTK
jgi:hypothetical protein